MTAPRADDSESLPLSAERRVDELCRRFEDAWKTGGRPRLEDFAAGSAGAERLALVRELIRLDVSYRRDHGEEPRAEDYLPRFPELDAACLNELLHVEGTAVFEEQGRPSRQPPASTEEQAGAVLAGRYKLLERVGEGGMGSVWVAQQTEPVKRMVAVKLIKAGGDSRAVLARFEAERQALALMDHPNIAKVLDAGTTERGAPFFVMELVKGVPITKFCDTRKLTPKQRLELFVPVCQAIQHAHQKGIIHRDIKPSNVLIALYDDKPVPKVIDFGVAKATVAPLTDATLHTGFGAIVGTPQYMSPEQATLNNLDIDTRSDIYSLGVLLYELLAGSPPFNRKELEKAGMLEILRVIREEEPPKPSTKVSTADALPSLAANRGTEPARLSRLLRGEIDWIVMKALDKERSRRYESANGLAMDIQRYLADEPVSASPPSAAYRLKKFVKRHKGRVMATVLVLLALLGGLAGTTTGLVLAEGKRRDAEDARRAEADRAEGERLAKERAQKATEEEKKATAKAEEAAKAEKAAKEQAEKRLKQIESGIVILTAMFQDLDPRLEEKEGESERVLFGRRLEEAARQLEGDAVGDPVTVARLQSLLGNSLTGLGHYQQAEAVLTKALRTQETLLKADHHDTLQTKNSLALLYNIQEKYPQAEKLLLEALEADAKLPPAERNALTFKHNLAVLYLEMGKFQRSEKLFEEVLEARSEKKGANDPIALVVRGNLAILYRLLGRYQEAEKEGKEVLAGFIAVAGPNHPQSVTAKHSLAMLYKDQGRYTEAEKLLKEALEGGIAKQGSDHPQTLATKQQLGLLYKTTGQYALAENLLRDVLEGLVTKLGRENPRTITAKSDLADLFKDAAKYPQAERLLKEALEGNVAQFGPDHLRTLEVKRRLGGLYRMQRNYAACEALYQEVLTAYRDKLGTEHPLTLQIQEDLAVLYLDQRKLAQAEKLFLEVLKGRTAVLGAEHLDTLVTKHYLGEIYFRQSKYEEAAATLKHVLETRVAKLPALRRDILTTKNDLAGVYSAQAKFAEAEPLLKESLDGTVALLGADHPNALNCQAKLGFLYWKMKKLDRSIPIFEEVVERRKKVQGAAHPDTLHDLVNLGVNYRDAGRMDDAVRCHDEVMMALFKLPGGIPGDLAWVPAEVALTYEMAKQYAKAEPLRRAFLENARKQHGDDDPRTAGVMAQLALNLLAQKKLADAEGVLRKCLAVRAQKEPDEWITFYTKSMLGEALLGQKKYAEAEPLLKDGYGDMKKHREKIPEPVRKQRLTEALQRLVQLYEATDNKDEAAKWRKELEEADKGP
jgi:serine/threonine protein kinase